MRLKENVLSWDSGEKIFQGREERRDLLCHVVEVRGDEVDKWTMEVNSLEFIDDLQKNREGCG